MRKVEANNNNLDIYNYLRCKDSGGNELFLLAAAYILLSILSCIQFSTRQTFYLESFIARSETRTMTWNYQYF